MGRRYKSLTSLHGYKCRDLFSSHAKRMKQSRKQVVREVRNSSSCYTPRAYPRSLYRPPTAPGTTRRGLAQKSKSHAMLDEIYRDKRKQEASQRIFRKQTQAMMNVYKDSKSRHEEEAARRMESQLLSRHSRRMRSFSRPNTAPAPVRVGKAPIRIPTPGSLQLGSRMAPLSRGDTVFGDCEKPQMGDAWTETDKGHRVDIFEVVEKDPSPPPEPSPGATGEGDATPPGTDPSPSPEPSEPSDPEETKPSTQRQWAFAGGQSGALQTDPAGAMPPPTEGNFIVAWSAEHLPSRPGSALRVREPEHIRDPLVPARADPVRAFLQSRSSARPKTPSYDARPGTASSLSMYRSSSTPRLGACRPGTAPPLRGIGVRGHAASLHKTRQQELQECEDIKLALARRGIRVSRGVLESALVTPVLNISPRAPRPKTAPAAPAEKGKGGKSKKKKGR